MELLLLELEELLEVELLLDEELLELEELLLLELEELLLELDDELLLDELVLELELEGDGVGGAVGPSLLLPLHANKSEPPANSAPPLRSFRNSRRCFKAVFEVDSGCRFFSSSFLDIFYDLTGNCRRSVAQWLPPSRYQRRKRRICLYSLGSAETFSMRRRKLILRNFQSPGDIVMLTAAVRDLHLCHPEEFVTDVRTSCPDLWLHNPYLQSLDENDPDVEVLDCHYPLIHRSNQAPYHFLHGFIEFLNDQLGTQVRPTTFKGDLHISEDEKAWFSAVEETAGQSTPFWLLVSGGKYDFTIKWWDPERYQEVIDYFQGKIEFVQVGEAGHFHPELTGAVDLRGETSLRQLVRLVYHAQGVLTPISLLMHLAAAVEVRPGMPQNRPCVVIAGGREPPHWTAYPHHQFVHTVGALWCCDNGGCWKSRTLPLGDGDPKDEPDQLCVDVVGRLPRCMDMISSEEVIHRIEMYFTGGALSYLDPTVQSPVPD